MTKKTTLQMYSAEKLPTWCPGCGNFQIWMAVKKALVNLDISPKDVLFVFDVGCNGNMADKIGGYRFHGLHGRVVPLAAGAALANRNVKVIAFGGDGATYGEGVNHLIHTFRSNYDFTLIVHNNGNYGLTTGQATATTKKGQKMNSAVDGVIEDSFDPIDFAFSMNSNFIAREFSSELNSLVNIFEGAIKHNGFSFVDVIQSCPTYDKGQLFDDFYQYRKDISEIPSYNNLNYLDSRKICFEKSFGLPTGILYKNEESLSFLDRLEYRNDKNTDICNEVQNYDISGFLGDLR